MSKKIDSLFDFWIKNNMNVLLEGPHGFGKTHSVISAFERNGLKWRYFSASTMDPWVDFVGVPKETVDADGARYLDLVRPREFQNDAVEAIFFDEFNRAPKKVRNAVMELIQFKSINGKKFNNLKVIWAAINPHDEDDTYDVEKLDPAQVDRFHVLFKMPAVPDREFFVSKYGEEIAAAALEWWNGIPKEHRGLVSARRLEYVIDCYMAGGDISYIVDKKTNPSRLIMTLSSGSVVKKFVELMEEKNADKLKSFLAKENNFDVVVDYLKSQPQTITTIFDYIDEERKMRLISAYPGLIRHLTKEENIDNNLPMLSALVDAGTLEKKEEERIRKIIARRTVVSDVDGVRFFEPKRHPDHVSKTAMKAEVIRLRDLLIDNNSENRKEAYNFLLDELTDIYDVSFALDILCILFRIIEGERDANLVTRYTMIIPLLNYVLDELDKLGVDINNPLIRAMFATGKDREINKPVKVQGFIDSNRAALANKKNKPILI